MRDDVGGAWNGASGAAGAATARAGAALAAVGAAADLGAFVVGAERAGGGVRVSLELGGGAGAAARAGAAFAVAGSGAGLSVGGLLGDGAERATVFTGGAARGAGVGRWV